MKIKLLTLLAVLTTSFSYAQICIPDIYALEDTILCNDSTIIIFGAIGGSEDFSCGGPCHPGWSSVGTQYDNPYSLPSPNGGTYMWMGPTTTQPREFITPQFNTNCGGNVCFEFVMAIQGGPSPTEGPDLSEEGISLQYSLDSGLNWIDLVYYMPDGQTLPSNPGAGYTPFGPVTSAGTPFTVWNSVCVPIPFNAQSFTTSFRWFQQAGSSNNFDHWGIDNVSISVDSDSMDVYLIAVNGVSTNQYMGVTPDTVSVSVDTATMFEYLINNVAYDPTNPIISFDTVWIYPAATDAGPDVTVSCSTIGIPLSVTGVMPYSNVQWTPVLGLDSPLTQNPFADPTIDQMYTVTSDCGVDSIFVNVVPIFTPTITTPSDSICVNDSTNLIVTSDQPGSSYTYTWTNNVPDDSSATTTVMPTINTTYYLEMISDSGCVRNDSILIYVGAVPKTIIFDGVMRVCDGDSTQILVNAIQPTFFDDFNQTGTSSIWADIQNGTENLDCGSVSGNALHFNDGPDRWAQLIPIEVLPSGGKISLDLVYGGSFGTACSFVGFFDRMELQYRISPIDPWVQIRRYAATTTWAHYEDTIPVGAAGPNTEFRFAQTSNGGTNNDNWAIDNLLVELDCAGTNCVNYTYDWTPTATVTDPTSLNPFFFPNVITTYSLSISPAGFNCNAAADSITIAVDELDITSSPNDTFLCQASTILLESEIQGLSGSCNEVYNLSAIPLNMLTGTATTVSLGDDQVTPFISIPFGFEFFCDTKTQFNISSNGLLNFTANDNGCCTGELIPTAGFGNHNDLIALFWEDLNPNNGGIISHFVTGTAPNRVQVIEFSNVPHFGSASTVSGQIQMHETSNVVEIHCLDCQNDASGSATLGIENTNGTIGYSPVGYNSDQWTAANQAWRFVPTNSPINFNYSWINGQNISDINSLTPLVSPTQSSDYILEVSNINNCLFYDTVQVEVYENVTTLTPNTDLCIGSTLQLQATGADNYTWTPNVALDDSAIANPITGTNADITYFVEFNTQGCIVNDSVTINVLALPTTAINNATDPINYCKGLNKELFVDNISGWTYTWSGPESGTGNAITVSTPGTYTVEFNDGSCTNSLTVNVIENSSPVFDFSSVDQVLCCTDDSTVINFATIVSNVTIADVYWNGNISTTNSETIRSTDDNFVESNRLKIVSDNGCIKEVDVPDIVTKCANPTFTHPDTIFSGTGEVFTLTIEDNEADNTIFDWTTTDKPNAITDNTVKNPTFNGDESNIYTANVTVTSVYGNKNCVDTAEASDYEVIDVKDPLFPDAFTPGNDDLNEIFKPVISTFAKITDFRIYNRWGALVYDIKTAENKEGWDGKLNGVPQKDDQYMYYITVEHPDKDFKTEGVVNLLK